MLAHFFGAEHEMCTRRLVAGVIAGAALLVPGAAAAAAQSAASAYPYRPVRLIVGFAPGGSDVPARLIAQRLGDRLGQPFVVDNRPGASSVLGTAIAAKAPADGYTLVFSTASHAVTAVYYRKLPYDAIKDFSPIIFVGSIPFALVVTPSLPATSVKEFVALARAKPGQLNYASPGTGSIGHLANVVFARRTGIQVTHVAYKGTGPSVTAVMSGEVQFMLPNLIGVAALARSGKLKALAVASVRRSSLAPDLPTMSEAGVQGFVAGTWYGVQAPQGTPPGVITLLNREIGAAIQAPELREKLVALGIELEPGTPHDFAKFIRAEIEKWGAAMKDAGLAQESY
jgi:tripartite-type tricarboxylate transporter receptor subunit TctC